jgi:uncharacterized protein (TIGR00156 family)
MAKKNVLFVGMLAMALVFGLSVTGCTTTNKGGSFTGPGATTDQNVTVSQAKLMRDDAKIVLTGTIVQALDKENYLFRDSTGDISCEIDPEIWRGLSVDVSDTVEISGKIDIKRGQATITVKNIRKL